MKAFTITQIASAVVVAGLLAACSATTPDKQTQLAELKAEQVKLAEKIKRLESELPADSTKETSVAKEVVTVALAPHKFDHYVQTQGSIESLENIQASAKTPGIITEVFVVEGQQVNKGQIIGQIDNSLLVRGVEELKSSLELATTVYQRQKNLWEQKIGSEVQYLQAKNNKESLERRLASLNEQIDMTHIKSPINGVVDEVMLRVGQNIAPGMPAVRIINNSIRPPGIVTTSGNCPVTICCWAPTTSTRSTPRATGPSTTTASSASRRCTGWAANSACPGFIADTLMCMSMGRSGARSWRIPRCRTAK